MGVPVFDPSKPFESVDAPQFDSSQPFEPFTPQFDPSKPFQDASPIEEKIGPSTRGPISRGLSYIARKLEPITPKNRGFPMLEPADIAAGRFETLLPGVDPETGRSIRSQASVEDNAAAPTWAKVAAGGERGVASIAEALPPFIIAGAAQSGVAVPLLQRGISAAFAADMIHGLPQQAKTFIQAVQNNDTQTAAESLISGTLGTIFAGLAAYHTVARTTVAKTKNVPLFDANGAPRIDPTTGKQVYEQRPELDASGKPIFYTIGIAEESPAIRALLTKKVVSEVSPQQMKEIYLRSIQGKATPAEDELVKFVNENIAAPGEAIRKGVSVTAEVPRFNNKWINDYLGLIEGGKTIRLADGKTVRAVPVTPETEAAQPQQTKLLGGPNADRISQSMEEARSDQAESVPTVPSGTPGTLQKPAGAVEAQAPGSNVAPPDAQSSVSNVPPVTPQPVEGERFVTIKRPDGTTYTASFGDKFYDHPKRGKVAAVGRIDARGQWTHGMLAEGETIEEQPTEAQKKAGNYKKDHVTVHGLDVAIENRAGTVRTGKDKGGNEWSVTMPAHYGYIKRTEGKDGDQLDVYVGENTDSNAVYIVDQIDPQTGKFDEHKSFVGFKSVADVVKAYDAAFSDGSGPRRRGHISRMTVDDFKAWVKEGDTSKPIAYKPEGGVEHGQRQKEGQGRQDVLKPTEAAGGKPPVAPATPKPPAKSGSSLKKPQKPVEETPKPDNEKPSLVPVAEVEKIPATENKGRIAIILPNGIAVVGGRFHAESWLKAVEIGVATDADLQSGFAGFVKPDGTAWGVNGKPLPNVDKVYIVDDRAPKPTKEVRQRPEAPKPAEPASTPIISKGDWIEYQDSYGKTRQGRVSAVLKTGRIIPGAGVLPPRIEYMVEDADGKAMVSPKPGTPLKKIAAPETKPAKTETVAPKPETKAPEGGTKPVLKPTDVDYFIKQVEEGRMIFWAGNEMRDAGLPIFQDIPKLEHKGYGMFVGKGPGYEITVDGGGAMARTGEGVSYTIASVKGEYPYDKAAVLKTLRAMKGEAPKSDKKPVAATDDNLKALSDDEFDALLDEASKPTVKESLPVEPKKPEPKPKASEPPSRGPSLRKPKAETPKTQTEKLTDAAKAIKDALDEAAKGLDDLFGGSTGTGPNWDEQRYQKAKPHFDKAWESAKRGGGDILDFLREIIKRWGEAVKPYLRRWREDLAKGATNENRPMDQRGGSAEAADVATTGEPSRKPGDKRGGRMGGEQPETSEGVGGGRKPADASTGGEQPSGGSEPEGGGGRGDESVTSRDKRGVRGAKQPPAKNYVITDADQLGKGTPKAKAAGNIEAIKLVQQLDAEKRLPTAEEKAKLVKYVGWGGVKGIFDEDNHQFDRERSELKGLITPEEFAAARASIQDAHYTSQTVIERGIYAALRRFGFTGGKMVEGGVGIGNFIGLLPAEWRARTSYIGIERDPLTARIAQYLYPEASIQLKGYQDADLARDSFDGAVGNPPFGKKAIYDKRFEAASKHTIHNYFIAKTLELTRPGGIVAQVVSRYFLDTADPTAREYIATKGEFLGAIRLPNTAFKENANTEVVTDLVFFQRVADGVKTDKDWTKVVNYRDPKSGLTWKVNKWIIDHPEMILGDMAQAEHGMYSKTDMSVLPRPNQDLGADLNKAVDNLPSNIYQPVEPHTKDRLTSSEGVDVPEGLKVGSYFVAGGKLYRRLPDLNGARQQTEVTGLKEGTGERVRAIIPIRDALNKLVRAEFSSESTDAQIEAARKELNKTYDAFVKRFKFLNSPTNRRAFYDDTDSMRVLGLERDYTSGISAETAKKKGVDEIKPSAKKADIFTKRVNVPYREVTSVETPQEALAVSLNQRGGVDVDYMADLMKSTPDKVLAGLEGLVFRTPEGTYESKEQYLSGNVRSKLKQAIEAAKENPEYAKNVEALLPVIPKDIEPTDIIAPLGAPWISAQDVSAFALELTGSEPRVIVYRKADSGWSFEHHDRSTASTQKWGTPRMPFGDMMKLLLNGKTVIVYDLIDDGNGGEKRIVNQQETELANAKASELKDKWQEWVWQDKDRRDRLHRIYNDTYNNFVDFKADGSHLSLPGASPLITLNPHQKNVVWRTITSGGDGLLYDQVVGSGKTFAGVASMMELKRLGRVHKWLVTVPNHLTGQWADAFNILYPNANILAAKPSDFKKENRQRLFSKILTGDYDGVVLGHSSLKKVGTSPEVEKSILNEMLAEIVSTIAEMKKAEGDSGRKRGSRAVAQMERTKDNIEAKIAKLANIGGRDAVAMFEELGFDGLVVDEAHEFKNLFYTTQMQNVAGLGTPKGSAKAFDLYLKIRYLRQQFAGKAPVVFLTGTPISNSLVEMFTMQRYLQPKILDEMGIKTLDAWARVFADVRPVYEVDPTGTGYRMATRLANFQNVGELTSIYRNMADVVTIDDLQTQAEVAGKRFPVPKVSGGKPENIVADRTPEQSEYFGIETQQTDFDGKPMFDSEGVPITSYPQGTILWRVDNMPDDPREDNMLKLTFDARSAGLDMRLINPSSPDRPESKVNRAVSEIVRIHEKWKEQKGTQLVFCDLSVPASARGRATKQAKTGGAGYYINVNNALKPVEGEAVTLAAKPGYEFFVHKSQSGSWVITERTSGVGIGVREATKKAAINAAETRLSGLKEGVFEDAVVKAQPTSEMLADFLENANAAKDEVEVEDEGDDTGDEQGVSVDELMADRSKFSVYDDMRSKLIKAGIPEKEIAFIHDYDTPEKKMKLFKAVNDGEVRVLFGSTTKMGAGTNVQRRIVALHHMDAPWRPSDLEQREGRAIRQGNLFYEEAIKQYAKPQDYDSDPNAFALEIKRYATRLTYDTRMWQIIEHKAAGIEGFRKADRSTRRIEDVSGEAANASDMKAAASGDPMIQQELQLRNDLNRLQLLRKAWERNRIELQNREHYLAGYEARYKSKMEAYEKRKALLEKNTPKDEKGNTVFEFWIAQDGIQRGKLSKEEDKALQDKINVWTHDPKWKTDDEYREKANFEIDKILELYKRTDEKGTALNHVVAALKKGKSGKMGRYRGFEFSFQPTITLKSVLVDPAKGIYETQEVPGVTFFEGGRNGNFVTDFTGDDKLTGVGLFQRFDNYLEPSALTAEYAESSRNSEKKQLDEVRLEIDKPFAKEEQLAKTRTEHEQVRSQLMNKKKKSAPPPSKQSIGPLAEAPVTQPEAEAAVRSLMGEVPENVRFINDPAAPRGEIVLIPGRRGEITLNLAKLGSTGSVTDTVLEELVHGVWDNPAVAEARRTIEGLVTEADRQRKAEAGYNPDETAEEAANERTRRIFEDAERANIFVRAWRAIVQAFKDLFGIKLSQSENARAAAKAIVAEAVKNRPTTGSGRRGAEPTAAELRKQRREKAIETGIEEKWIPTQVGGTTDYVRGREQITPLSTSESLVHARNIFNEAGIEVTRDQDVGGWRIVDRGYDQSAAGRLLADILKREIRNKNEPGKAGDLLASLLNSVVYNFKAGSMANFDTPTRQALYSIAQSDRSQRGLALGSLAGFGEDLQFVAQNVDVVLNRIWSDAYGGEALTHLLDRVITNFRGYFTDAEIAAALKESAGAEQFINRIIALNRRDEGGKVYRRVQALLKPKQAKTLAKLEADARVEEAVNEILAQASRQGIEPRPTPGKPLPALHKLLLLVSEKNAATIDKLIANAVADAERNAGIAAQLKAAESVEEAEEWQQRFAEGEEPSAEMIEEGLNLPQFSHWRDIRDNLLDYSPVTLKLVQDVVRGSFKGTIRGKAVAKPDVRLDLNLLAKSPEEAVAKALDEYLTIVQANMDIEGATPQTQARIEMMLRQEVEAQLEAARKRFRSKIFTAPLKPGEKPTDEQRMAQLLNAGLFRDENLDIPAMVERAAGKSQFQKLNPTVADLIKRVFATPFYRQQDLATEFAAQMVRRFGVPEDQAAKAAELFSKAFEKRFAVAREKAAKAARETITPQEMQAIGMKKSVWRRIEQAVNSGLFDTGSVLREIAAEHHWKAPTDDQVARMKRWSEEEQRLRELTPEQRAAVGTDPAKLELARLEKEKVFEERRTALKKKIEAEWARITRPLALPGMSLESYAAMWEHRKNNAAALNELASANILLKAGFIPRQFISVLTQGAIHTPTRAIAHALINHIQGNVKGSNTKLLDDIQIALRDSYKVRLASLHSALYATRAAFLGRGEARNVDRLMSSIGAIERIVRKADEAAEAGRPGEAMMYRLMSLIRLGYRVAQAFDNIHGLPAEYQEMVLQVENGLRQLGMNRAQIEANKHRVFGTMQADWARAIDQARMWFESEGKKPTSAELHESAWILVKAWQYERIRDLGLPADDFQERNRLLRSTVGWNERETRGLGGLVGSTIGGISQAGESIGIPLMVGRFGNAIAISINRALSFTPFASLSNAFGPGTSAWHATEADRLQRKLEMAGGSMLGLVALLAVLAGAVVVRLSMPRDPEERALWEKQGIRPNTVEFHLGNGSFIPFSLNTGPMAPLAPYFAAGGALHDLAVSRQKAQEKLNAEAAKRGVTPGKINPISIGDQLAVAAAAAQGVIMGGRTAAGLLTSLTDYGVPNSQKLVASQLSPLVPGLPALQEVSRMAGVALDAKMATVWDFMLPLPTSAARKVNLLGDPAGTPNDLQRIIQVLTAGTYPGIVTPAEATESAAYATLYESGYRPPSIDPNRGYAIGGEYRPLTPSELAQYTVKRGQNLKSQLIAAGPTADPKVAAAAYKRANDAALAEIGVEASKPAARTPEARPLARLPRGYRGASLRRRRPSLKFSKGPSLRLRRSGLRLPMTRVRIGRGGSLRRRGLSALR